MSNLAQHASKENPELAYPRFSVSNRGLAIALSESLLSVFWLVWNFALQAFEVVLLVGADLLKPSSGQVRFSRTWSIRKTGR